MRVLITRPQEDAEPLAAVLQEHGVGSLIAPMMDIHIHDGPDVRMAGVQALLLTSVNGARAMARRTPVRDIPVLAVGDATARIARAEGFLGVESAGGDVNKLAALAIHRHDPLGGELVHAAGSRVAGDLGGQLGAAHFYYRREVLYDARAVTTLPQSVVTALMSRGVNGVMLYSPRTAAIFVELLRMNELQQTTEEMIAFCLSQAVADEVSGLAWREVVAADRPEQAALLDQVLAHSR